MNSRVEEKFSDFYRKWMGQLEDFLQLLLVVSREHSQAAEDIVNKLTAHHKQYYTFKWAAAHEDVLAFFTPVWLSRLEIAHLWVTGWKPSLAFRLVESLRNARPPVAAASLA
ncbi:UNVERIFIED_CONTAM: protein DOG1-like 4 [Sesamum radiatum]|uniref:Protein DOG1-like 4 n=1 Tax=Sesamum radiatum TaxID=300843 RepID=A0AAW2KI86_SESRA